MSYHTANTEFISKISSPYQNLLPPYGVHMTQHKAAKKPQNLLAENIENFFTHQPKNGFYLINCCCTASIGADIDVHEIACRKQKLCLHRHQSNPIAANRQF